MFMQSQLPKEQEEIRLVNMEKLVSKPLKLYAVYFNLAKTYPSLFGSKPIDSYRSQLKPIELEKNQLLRHREEAILKCRLGAQFLASDILLTGRIASI